MKRREFIAGLAGAAVVGHTWPAYGQQAVPIIGFLYSASPDTSADRLRAFRQGLKEYGYIEGENVLIIYRWAENQIDKLPELALELVQRNVAVIAAPNSSSAMAAKVLTTTIPIVFAVNQDPIRLGLVTSVARPEGNLTGINFLSAELVSKRLEVLRELVPNAARVAVLVNPAGPTAEATVRDLEPAARSMGLKIQVLNTSTSLDIDAAFATFFRDRPDVLFVSSDGFFANRRIQLVQLAARHALPATYGSREIAEVGGLMSYGASIVDAYRQVGAYTGRLLKGVKPLDLPVVQASKFELVINAQTARMLGITVPPTLLARADEVIE